MTTHEGILDDDGRGDTFRLHGGTSDRSYVTIRRADEIGRSADDIPDKFLRAQIDVHDNASCLSGTLSESEWRKLFEASGDTPFVHGKHGDPIYTRTHSFRACACDR